MSTNKVKIPDGRTGTVVSLAQGQCQVQLDDGTLISLPGRDLKPAGEPTLPGTPSTTPSPESVSPRETTPEAGNPATPARSNPEKSSKTTPTKEKSMSKEKSKKEKKPRAPKKPAGKPMEALIEAREEYVKGRVSVHNGDNVALALDGLEPADVVKLATSLVEGVEKGRWAHLNPGQQRMNAGNVLRAAVKRGDLSITALKDATQGMERREKKAAKPKKEKKARAPKATKPESQAAA